MLVHEMKPGRLKREAGTPAETEIYHSKVIHEIKTTKSRVTIYEEK